MGLGASSRLILRPALLVACAGAGLAGSASAHRATVVGFAVRGNPAARVSAPAGKKVSFVARATMRTGDRLQILVGRRATGRRTAVSCALSPCAADWREKRATKDQFQAVLQRAGSVIARSRTITVTWKPAPPPPPPAPAAAPGHYEGQTSQDETFAFDVTADGRGLVNLTTGQINESCTPPGNLSGGNIGPVAETFPVALDGSFTISGGGPLTVGGVPAVDKIVIAGRIADGTASGTLRDDTSLSLAGVSYACSSGDQTWTATKVG
jgi:hypothetical protein